jgi:hypothetical protein
MSPSGVAPGLASGRLALQPPANAGQRGDNFGEASARMEQRDDRHAESELIDCLKTLAIIRLNRIEVTPAAADAEFTERIISYRCMPTENERHKSS